MPQRDARALNDLLLENERLRREVSRINCKSRSSEMRPLSTEAKAAVAEALGVPNLVRRYQRALKQSQRRIDELELALKQKEEQSAFASNRILERAVECLEAAKLLYEKRSTLPEPAPMEERPVPEPSVEAPQIQEVEAPPEPPIQHVEAPPEPPIQHVEAPPEPPIQHVEAPPEPPLRRVEIPVTEEKDDDARCDTLKQEIGNLDAEITILRAALRESIQRYRH